MHGTVGRLINALDKNDRAAPVYVNVNGHLMRIAMVLDQVGYAEILLIDENETPCFRNGATHAH